jgi:hypothetical protein
MDLGEFERLVIAGEITDFKPYFDEADDEDEIYVMRKICIENDANRKAYRDWADEFVHFEKDEDLQFLLVDNYHCLDILICSENKEVRRAVIEQDIEYALDEHIVDYDQDIIVEQLINEIKPHAELLDTFLRCNDGSWDPYLVNALELKQKARNIVPTTIEKTMSPIQLFEARNPLWTLTLTGYQVYDIINSSAGILELQTILNGRER